MNIWFSAALLFTLGAAICGFIGTQQQSNEDSKGLEKQFTDLGEKIADLSNSDQPNESEIVEVKEEYAKLADEYYESRHQKAAKIIADKSSNIATQLEKSQKAKEQFNELHQTILNIVEAYNEKSETTKVNVVRTNVLENLFVSRAYEKAYIGIFTETERWAIRLDKSQNEIRYEFGRLKTNVKDYKDMEDLIHPFDINVSVAQFNNQQLDLILQSGSSQEYSYLSDNSPNTSSLNILAEDVVLRIVELLLLPSINE